MAATTAGCHHLAASHVFQDGQAKPFVQAGLYAQGGGGNNGRQIGVGHPAQRSDDILQPLGRDPGELSRSANMALKITDKHSEVKALGDMVAARMGPHAADAHDTCLAGSADQIRDTLGALKESGVDTVFLPTTFSPADVFKADSDEFITNIAKDFRS